MEAGQEMLLAEVLSPSQVSQFLELSGQVDINGGAIIDHEAPRERRFVAVEK